MTGFQIIDKNSGECIHEETGFDVESTQDMYDDVLRWWNGDCDDGTDPNELLVKLFDGVSLDDLTGEEEELLLSELL